MRVCIVSDHLYGGSGVVAKELAEKLAERNNDVVVLSAKVKEIPLKRKKNLKVYLFEGFPLPKLEKKIYIATPINPISLYKIFKIIKNSDIVHVISLPSILALISVEIAKFLKKPVIAGIQGQPENFLINLNMDSEKLKKFLYRYFARCYNKADLVIGPSEFSVKIYKNYGLKTKFIVISNGVDRKIFNEKVSSAPFFKKYKLSRNKKKILFLGRLMKEKNVDIFLNAAKIVLRKIPDVDFVVAGTGYYRENLENLAEKLGVKDSVLFTGYVPPKMLPSVYAASDLFVLPSSVELQGLVLLEAISTGKPIIGTNVNAIPELVINGYNGFLFEEKNHKDLAEKIVKIISNKELQNKFSKNSLKLAKQHDIKKSIDKLERVYRNFVV